MKINISENPDKSEQLKTIGSKTNISKGLYQITRISRMFKRFLCNSLGPQIFNSLPSFAASFLRLLASLSNKIVDLVSIIMLTVS